MSKRRGPEGESAVEAAKRQRQQRVNLPKDAKDYLSAWLYNHLDNPYPSEDEKKSLAQSTSLTFDQVNNWFINSSVYKIENYPTYHFLINKLS